MRAIVRDEYGTHEVVRLQEVVEPAVEDDGVLVRVHTASIHAGDWLLMTGRPLLFRPGFGLRRPKKRIPGFDFAGTVETTGVAAVPLADGSGDVDVAGDLAVEDDLHRFFSRSYTLRTRLSPRNTEMPWPMIAKPQPKITQ
jgi:NADPH:quinone reductase-like Zn-dependent oxidoreductase